MRFAAIALALVTACGGTGSFGLTADDNNPQLLKAAMDGATPREAGKPLNAAGKSVVYVVIGGKQPKLAAYDLSSGAQMWSHEGDVKSRVVFGRDFVAHLDGAGKIVARDAATGAAKWSKAVTGQKFLGLTADADRVYLVEQSSGTRWTLTALDGRSGEAVWAEEQPGQLGMAAAWGGLVFSPFLKQWLVVRDARTGKQLTAIRGTDEEISFVRVDSDAVYFGSKNGVILLDERAASGSTAKSTYGQATLPKEFVRSFYHWDAFDPVQAGYSAYDRNRLLWRGQVAGDKLAFIKDRIVVHTFRFFFGFDATSGELVWAYNNPRADAVASEHVGDAIAFVSMYGDVVALDPQTGAVLGKTKLDLGGGTVRGATFDAEGWKPAGGGEPPDTAKALVSIARDRDARFLEVKLFALTALGKIQGGDVTADLLALIQDDKTPPKVHDKAVQVLVARKDVAGLPVLVDALSVRHDYIAGTQPRAVGVVARAIAAMGDLSAAEGVDAATRGGVVDALVHHLFEPQTSVADLTEIVKALGTIGLPGTMRPLRQFLLTYRSDPAFSTQVAAVGATIDALLTRGGVAERELVAFVADDPRTQPGVAEYAARALRQTDRKRAHGD